MPGGPAGTPARAAVRDPVLPFNDAVLAAAGRLVEALPSNAAGRALTIDPLIDGLTGDQLTTTRSMEARIVDIVRDRRPNIAVDPFTSETIARRPLVLVGSLTPADRQESPRGAPEALRIWLVLADLASGKIAGKVTVFAKRPATGGSPTAFFRDSPAWRGDGSIQAYLRTCAAAVGDPIDAAYLDGILAAALTSDAISAYDGGRYRDSLDLYESASRTPGGDQLRVQNGIYLANFKLGRTEEARAAFTRIVDDGLGRDRLSLKLLFRSGSTLFVADPAISGPYAMWLETIGGRVATAGSCLDVIGHASPTGSEPLNERLSLLRAEHVRTRLVEVQPALSLRTATRGVGSREAIVGTGTEDAADSLDRRVEFAPRACRSPG